MGEYSSCYMNALRKSSDQLEKDINEFLMDGNIKDNDVLSISIKHDVENSSEDYEYCTITAIVCYRDNKKEE